MVTKIDQFSDTSQLSSIVVEVARAKHWRMSDDSLKGQLPGYSKLTRRSPQRRTECFIKSMRETAIRPGYHPTTKNAQRKSHANKKDSHNFSRNYTFHHQKMGTTFPSEQEKALQLSLQGLVLPGPGTDKFSICNIAELQDISSFKNRKYPQKYPHSKNILLDVKTACWTKNSAGCFC